MKKRCKTKSVTKTLYENEKDVSKILHLMKRPIQGTILCLFMLMCSFTLTAQSPTFNHQVGHSGRSLQSNGMQSVHTTEIIVYVPASRSTGKTLVLPENRFNYSRWYQYDTDSKVTTGSITVNSYSQMLDNKGIYRIATSTSSTTNALNANYILPNNMINVTTGKIVDIACDLSYYKDYSVVNNNLLIEPTLSQRVIFSIHPAAEMVAMLAPYANSNGGTNESYLEEYEITAPNDRIVRFGPHYNYMGSNSNYYINNLTATSNGTWYKNGVAITNPTVSNNRVLAAPATNTTGTVVYTLVANGFGIAKFTVNYEPVTAVGPYRPAIVSESRLLNDYIFITGINFDSYSQLPLPWDETSYGFSYPDWERSSNGNRHIDLACWSEYTFMNSISSAYSNFLRTGIRDMSYENDNSKTNGRFLYVDASTSPGKFAQLRFDNGGLCPGTRMYVSAWVNNVSKHSIAPNLNFSIIGINNDGSEETLNIYTTGDIEVGNSGGLWRQIFFEFKVPNKEYAEYRLQVTNNGQSSIGNDFAIDNIAVYKQKTGLMNYQADNGCETLQDIVMMRLDISSLDLDPSSEIDSIYYQYQKADGTPIQLNNYIGNAINYGKILIEKADTKINYPEYLSTEAQSGLQQFYQKREDFINGVSTVDPGNIFITKEVNYLNELVDVYYVLHKSATYFKPDSTIKCVVAMTPASLTNQDNCSMENSITFVPLSSLVLNGVLNKNMEGEILCPNEINEISIRSYGSKGDLTEVVEVDCFYDWLYGNNTDYANGGKYALYDYDAIKTAIEGFRMDNPTAIDLSGITASTNVSQAQLDLLGALISNNILILASRTLEISLLPGITYMTVFPIEASAYYNDELYEICSEPLVIKLHTASNTNFFIGKNSEYGMPVEVRNNSRIIRMSEVDANNPTLTIPICQINNITIQELSNSDIYLLNTTTDKGTDVPLNDLSYTTKTFNDVETSVVAPDTFLLISNRHSGFNFKQGHRYDLAIVLEKNDDGTCNSNGYFSIIVVPDYVMWTPKENSNSWHRDSNWTMTDAVGNTSNNSGKGFVPMNHTNVIVTAAESKPILKEVSTINTQSAMVLNDNAQANISWDLNFVANSSRNIHFNAHAQLANQQLLNYDSAWVDMAIETNSWVLIAPPMNEMVVGDMYITSDGIENNPLFSQVESPDSRGEYEFYTSIFNNESKMLDRNGIETPVTATQWSIPFNALESPINIAHGYAIYTEGKGEDEVVVRLPKRDTIYYYYGTYGERTELFERIPRSGKGYRLAATDGDPLEADFSMRYDQTQTSHLMANPYLTELDIVKFMNHTANSSSATGTYSIYDKNSATGMTTYSIPLNLSTSGSAIAPIPMMSSFLVHIDPANNAPYLTVLPEMFYDSNDISSSEAPARSSLATANKNILRITAQRNNEISQCVIVEVSNSRKTCHLNEDALLIMMSEQVNPSAIYSKVDNNALVINAVPSIDMIPIGIAIQNSNATEFLSLTFDGVSDFNGDLELFDSKTNKSALLSDGMRVSIPNLADSDERYYIRSTSNSPTIVEEFEEEEKIGVYQPQNGQIYITSTVLMKQIRIYSITGQKIIEMNEVDSFSAEFNLPNGVYLIDIELSFLRIHL